MSLLFCFFVEQASSFQATAQALKLHPQLGKSVPMEHKYLVCARDHKSTQEGPSRVGFKIRESDRVLSCVWGQLKEVGIALPQLLAAGVGMFFFYADV